MRKGEYIALGISLVLFSILLGILITSETINTSDAINLILIFALVLVTFLYAKRTMEISDSTRDQTKAVKDQADASLKIALAAQEQTKALKETVSMSIRPSISLSINSIKSRNSYPFEPPEEIGLTIKNSGKGAATNLVILGEGKEKKVEYSQIQITSLGVGEEKTCAIHRTIDTSKKQVRVAYIDLKAIYNDDLLESWSTTVTLYKNGEWQSRLVVTSKLE